MIEKEPSFGYRTVAWLLGFNKNTVQHIFQIKGWQVRKRQIGMRPRIEAVPSVATAPNERWSTGLCRVWAGRDGWTTLALVIDCHTRELLGWHLSRSGKATTAASALEHALINRFGTLGKVTREFLLRSDNGLVCTTRRYTALVRSYGLKQEFITPHCPQQNGMVERVIRTCVNAPLDASGILGAFGHVIRCGRVSGLEDAACHAPRACMEICRSEPVRLSAALARRCGIPAHCRVKPDCQRAAALERFIVARPVPGLVGRWCRSAHADQLPRWIHKMNPSRALCNRADLHPFRRLCHISVPRAACQFRPLGVRRPRGFRTYRAPPCPL